MSGVRTKAAVRGIIAKGGIAEFMVSQYCQSMKIYVVTDIHNEPAQEQCVSMRPEGSIGVIRLVLNELCNRPDLNGEALHRYLFHLGGPTGPKLHR